MNRRLRYPSREQSEQPPRPLGLTCSICGKDILALHFAPDGCHHLPGIVYVEANGSRVVCEALLPDGSTYDWTPHVPTPEEATP